MRACYERLTSLTFSNYKVSAAGEGSRCHRALGPPHRGAPIASGDPRGRRANLRPKRSGGRGRNAPDSPERSEGSARRAQERVGGASRRRRASAVSGAGAPAVSATPTRGTGATKHIKRLSQTGLNRASGSERRDRKPTTGGGSEGIWPKEVDRRLRSPFPSPADGVRGLPPRVGSRKPKRAERAREREGDRREWGAAW